jgi:hypothetical protein
MTSEPTEPIVAADNPLARQVTEAIRTGDTQALQRLLHDEPDLARIRIGDTECSRTLLHVATDWTGHYPRVSRTIQILIDAGADPDARFIGRSHQETPLHWAASSGDVEAVVLVCLPRWTAEHSHPAGRAGREHRLDTALGATDATGCRTAESREEQRRRAFGHPMAGGALRKLSHRR